MPIGRLHQPQVWSLVRRPGLNRDDADQSIQSLDQLLRLRLRSSRILGAHDGYKVRGPIRCRCGWAGVAKENAEFSISERHAFQDTGGVRVGKPSLHGVRPTEAREVSDRQLRDL